MNEQIKSLAETTAATMDRAAELVGRLFDVARPGAVFGEPVSAEGKTVITASEVMVGMGFGMGMGGGQGEGPAPAEEAGEDGDQADPDPTARAGGEGAGGGGGGGGASFGRPVAAIIIDADGSVRVEPIVDPTKIALAFFTMIGSAVFMIGRMVRR